MNIKTLAPTDYYGVREQRRNKTMEDRCLEQLERQGFANLDSGLSPAEIEELAAEFDRVHREYVREYGKTRLESIDEQYTVRAPLLRRQSYFRALAFNTRLMAILDRALQGTYILNQQNGIINPPGERYNQGKWHRDFPYQHFVTDRPLGINALYCVDNFTLENGATYVLPGSHKVAEFPSSDYIAKHALQLAAPAGHFILLNCMVFHTGGYNNSRHPRRAVNHVFNIPFFKQQINLPQHLERANFTEREAQILGFDYRESESVEDYLTMRTEKGR